MLIRLLSERIFWHTMNYFLSSPGVNSWMGKHYLSTCNTLQEVCYCSVLLSVRHISQKILSEFPGLIQLVTRWSCKFINSTTHVIDTSGQPVTARPRSLPPEKLRTDKSAFEEMLQFHRNRSGPAQFKLFQRKDQKMENVETIERWMQRIRLTLDLSNMRKNFALSLSSSYAERIFARSDQLFGKCQISQFSAALF